MSVFYNGAELETFYCGGQLVENVYFNGVEVGMFKAYIAVTSDAGLSLSLYLNGSEYAAGTADSGGSITFTVRRKGTYTIINNGKTLASVEVAEKGKTYEVTAKRFNSSLNENTWEEIRNASDEGLASSYWKVGDYKDFVLNGTAGSMSFTDEPVRAVIIGFDHNSAREGTNKIHFQILQNQSGRNIALYGAYMQPNQTDPGGWEDTYMHDTIMPELLDTLPQDLRNVLKTVTKWTDNTGGQGDSTVLTSTEETLFLLSSYEVYGKTLGAHPDESSYQQRYTYWAEGNSKTAYRHNDTGTKCPWWLRSVTARIAVPEYPVYSFAYVEGSSNTSSGPQVTRGVRPAFCV